ncbi:hypothetical protein HPC49_11285 [Pyxidicoccus fallax]|uniref:Lipoprotein n=1 Tax=Pyxidicoccus fallax TaxID=394095 RepID=A0A848LH02_9BACT|nr:hypothetical protein [Pyxidicoccus fallax]NMO17113.1 hypothetical protein [Pyxidicoccus fallax]NPC78822.1 hypothetical protein [Pyxidicoccus fallax]
MRNLLAVSLVSFSLLTVACGSATPEQTPAPAEQKQGLNAVGTGCNADSECASGLCWVEADSYPYYNPYWIRADSCTEECGGLQDTYCQQLAAEYNAPYPEQARCIPARGVYDNNPDDHSVFICDLIPAGLGKVHWVE